MESKSAITEIPLEQAHFVCRLFLVSKKGTKSLTFSHIWIHFSLPGGGQRPVLNLRPLNDFTRSKHFKLESIPVVKEILREGDWMCTVSPLTSIPCS